MSFGYSVGDAILLTQLAWRTVQDTRQACGEHDELTREVSSLHKVLERLQRELANPESPLNHADDSRRKELNEVGSGCEQILKVMDSIVTKYNALSEDKRSGKKLWQKIKFGNGEVKDLPDLRLKLSAHTSAILMSLNLCSLGSQGRVERQLNSVGGDLEGIREKVDWIAANITARSGDGTVWTSYEDDDRAFWRELRRGLVKEGYRSSIIHKHKHLITDYVEELGKRGVFDQNDDFLACQGTMKDIMDDDETDDGPKNYEKNDSREESQVGDKVTDEMESEVESLELEQSLRAGKSHPSVLLLAESRRNAPTENLQVANEVPIHPSKNVVQPFPVQMEEVLDEEFSPHLDQVLIGEDELAKEQPSFVMQAHVSQKTQTPALDVKAPGTERVNVALDTSSSKESTLESHSRNSLQPDTVERASDDPLTAEEWNEVRQPLDDEQLKLSDPQKWLALQATLSQQAFAQHSMPYSPEGDEGVSGESAEKENTKPTDGGQSQEMPGHDKQNPESYIKFKDCFGRKFKFPLHLARTWEDMEVFIHQLFEEMETIGVHVLRGHYDMVSNEGEIILPSVWNEWVGPGLKLITMHLWPIPELSEAYNRRLEDPKSIKSVVQVNLIPPPPPGYHQYLGQFPLDSSAGSAPLSNTTSQPTSNAQSTNTRQPVSTLQPPSSTQLSSSSEDEDESSAPKSNKKKKSTLFSRMLKSSIVAGRRDKTYRTPEEQAAHDKRKEDRRVAKAKEESERAELVKSLALGDEARKIRKSFLEREKSRALEEAAIERRAEERRARRAETS